ncbi:DNA repair photolyase [Fontimonas thermophila]|uniref:DNA repair photolyase n=1 Tax=Fontimonas thermophila TaxID=1076937 RepID=A0A1I2HV03_9GAMM|nr:PA0069 family radical SAM protein [Fontimonas thermophila]SFF33864.1 DNA repair photolyase [Fontimonas thermophila]
MTRSPIPHKGRGATINPQGRFETLRREPIDDGWGRTLRSDHPPMDGQADLSDEDVAESMEAARELPTQLFIDHARTIITRNVSPDIPFRQSINPYRGCEHGCVYCYARPAHAYLDLSPGLDFETKLFYKPDAARLLEAELRKPGYRPQWIALGANTDPWQPVERRLGITRGILEVLARFRHPVGIVTKGAVLIERDIDLLADMARDDLVMVAISVTTLDPALKRTLEPRASAPATRLRVMRKLADAGVPVMVMFSPVIPFVNDAELERVLEAAYDAGARHAAYVMLRLPHEVKELFRAWLDVHLPLKAAHVMSLVTQMRGGKDYDSAFGTRMRGEGAYADVIAQRFRTACKRLGLNAQPMPVLSTAHFRVPPGAGDQIELPL